MDVIDSFIELLEQPDIYPMYELEGDELIVDARIRLDASTLSYQEKAKAIIGGQKVLKKLIKRLPIKPTNITTNIDVSVEGF